MQKIKDIAVKVGEYSNQQGEKKGRYKSIGMIMRDNDGSEFALLDATVLSTQLLMLCNRDRKDKVAVSLFEPRENQQQGGQQQDAPPPQDDYPF